MKRSSLLLQINFYDLFGIVPGAARISHENRLIQTEDRNRYQVADEVERFNECERKSGKKDSKENIQHSLLRVLSANLHHFLAIRNRSFLHAFQSNIRFDEFDRAVSSGGHSLGGCASEPVNHRPTSYQSEHKGRVQQRELIHVYSQAIGQGHDDRENHGCCADNRSADQHRFCGSFECVPCPIIGLQQVFRAIEVHIDVEVPLDFRRRNVFDERQLIN